MTHSCYACGARHDGEFEHCSSCVGEKKWHEQVLAELRRLGDEVERLRGETRNEKPRARAYNLSDSGSFYDACDAADRGEEIVTFWKEDE